MNISMNISEAITILKQHNAWRRGATDIEQESPTLIGIAIDEVTIAAGRYEKLRMLNALEDAHVDRLVDSLPAKKRKR